jgi:flagellar protein FliO/FliZ
LFPSRVILLCLCLIIAAAAQTGFPAFAQQSPTVKECLQRPSLCDQPANSPKSKAAPAEQAQPSPFSVWDIVRLIGATLLVIALIYGLLKFLYRRGQLLPGKKGVIEHLGGTSVGANRSVQLIKVGNRILVIGVGESIQLLCEIAEEDEMKEILALHNERLEHMLEPGKWGARLRDYLADKRKQSNQPRAAFHTMLLREMQELSVKRNELLKQLKQKGTAPDE